jgi:hypothetical protein
MSDLIEFDDEDFAFMLRARFDELNGDIDEFIREIVPLIETRTVASLTDALRSAPLPDVKS